MSRLRIAIAQINCRVGDFSGNVERILAAAVRARAQGAELLLTPELALCGYPPEDLLLRPDFYRLAASQLQTLASRAAELAPGLALLVGHPEMRGELRYNAASLLQDGRIVTTYHKQRLLNQQAFDESRYFVAGNTACVLNINGVRCGLAICADIWTPGVAEASLAAGAELLLVLNASPFHLDKTAQRHEALRARIAATGLPLIYANLVGGQDELVFDGASCVFDANGKLTHQLPHCAEALVVIDYCDGQLPPGDIAATPSTESAVYAALKLGLRDYIEKNNFPGAIIGFSGGADSALVLAIAVDALGAQRVRAMMLPSPYTSQMSLDDARAMAGNLGVRYEEIAIGPAMQTFAELLAAPFADLLTHPAETTAENLQARIRGMLLMALSNKTGAIVLTTSNKSETAVGYATLYGDMAGGLAVLKDVYKTLVYRLCRYRNSLRPDIPENILTRAPSAELKPNQTDQDSLPDYAVLDAIVAAYMEHNLSPREIIAQGHAAADVQRVLDLLKGNEYKRRQAPVGIRITPRSFGKDWRYPITSRYPGEW
jgi:NAD+ synthetase